MARRRVTVPSIARIKELEGVGSTRLERAIFATSKADRPLATNSGATMSARARASRNMSYETAMAIQAAKAGDDTELLPYQPTPSINPPRPRTLAAGYDGDTGTMRVRFRDGVGYEYYNVSPREWQNFKRVKSPGRAINRIFNHKDYSPAAW